MPYSIASNAATAAAARLASAVLGLAATALLIRSLGPDRYGVYAVLLSLGTIVQLAADFGLYLTLTRAISQQPSEEPDLLSYTAALRLLLLAAAFFIGIAILPVLPTASTERIAFFLLALGFSFQSLSQLFMGVFQRHGEVWRAALGDIAGRLVQLILLAAIFTSASVQRLAAIFTVSAGVAFLFHQQLLPAGIRWRPRVSWLAWRKLLLVSWPLGLMLVLNAVYFRLDAIMLSFFRPGAEVGWYSAAYRLIESFLFFPAMLGGLLLPPLSAAVASNQLPIVRRYLVEGLKVAGTGAIFIMVVLTFFSRDVIVFLAGDTFAPAAPLLPVLGLALAMMWVGNILGFALVALSQQKKLLTLYAVLVVFNALVNLLFIPRWGAAAAAWTTVATEAVSVSVALWLVHRYTHLRARPAALMRAAALMALTAAAAAAPAPLLIRGALAVFVFTLGAIKIARLTPRHLRLIFSSPLS